MAGVFDPAIFQSNVFQQEAIGGDITSTATLQKPVNCVLAGQQNDIKGGWREHEIHAPRIRYKTVMGRGSLKKGDG